MNQNEFMRQQQAAVERMREMNARAQINRDTSHKMPPIPSFVRMTDSNSTQHITPPTRQNQENHQPQQSRSVHKESIPASVNHAKNSHNNPFTGSLNIPFLDSILKDGDSTLIIGLLLILMSENTDKMLMFALIYILL